MFIESLKVSYPSEGWSLEETKFDRFNLLVGASGVGKTRILRAILDLKRIATEGDLEESWDQWNSFEWEINFRLDLEGPRYTWKGKLSDYKGAQRKRSYYIEEESIDKGGQQIVTRDKKEISLNGQKMPKLSPFASTISLLSEENIIEPIFSMFLNVSESEELDFSTPFYEEELELDKYDTLEAIRNSSEDLRFRIWWAYNNREKFPVFDLISQAFKDIFPNVVGFEMSDFILPRKAAKTTIINFEIEEVGVDVYLDYGHLASGMKKTLDLLGQIYLLPNNSLILIDEFENGLGANCIDLVAEAVQNANRGLQFIITSHHPYIINKIGFKHWKIVTRKGGVVSTHPASEFGLGRSRHENFNQLVQLEAFQTGMMPE